MKQNWDTLQQSGISTSTGCERAIYTNPQIQLKEGAVIIVMTWAVTTRLIRHHRQTKRATCSFMTEITGQEQSPWQPKTSSHNATVPTISIYWSTDREPRLSHPVVTGGDLSRFSGTEFTLPSWSWSRTRPAATPHHRQPHTCDDQWNTCVAVASCKLTCKQLQERKNVCRSLDNLITKWLPGQIVTLLYD